MMPLLLALQATPANPEMVGAEFSMISLQSILEQVQPWAKDALDAIISVNMAWQLLAVLAALSLAWMGSRRPRKRLVLAAQSRESQDILYRIYNALSGAIWPIFTVVFIWGFFFVFRAAELPTDALRIIASLVNAWIVVRLLTKNMMDGPVRTTVSMIAWGIAALYIMRLLTPIVATLDSAAFSVGEARVSVYQVMLSLVFATVALWVGRVAGDAAQVQLKSSKRLTPSMAGLLGQVAKIGLMVVALIIALSTVGIHMSSFAFLSGAIGLGIGFGLQSIFSNFISGIIILFERSVTVGDYIELQSGVRGEVREINIRSTLVTTNDSVDILVPNEEFIKAQVINWTLRDPRRRLRIPFGVAYGTDKEVVKKAALEAADAVEWTEATHKSFKPAVWLTEFGDSSLNYELVVWLKDAAVKKPSRVHADYNWALHTALEKYGLEIPFPQRDLNIRQGTELSVRVLKD